MHACDHDRSQHCMRMRESPAIQVSRYITLLWKLQVFTAFRRENASASPFFTKDKSFPEKIRFSFGNYLNYYLQHLSFDAPAVIFTCQFLWRNLRRGKSFITPIKYRIMLRHVLRSLSSAALFWRGVREIEQALFSFARHRGWAHDSNYFNSLSNKTSTTANISP